MKHQINNKEKPLTHKDLEIGDLVGGAMLKIHKEAIYPYVFSNGPDAQAIFPSIIDSFLASGVEVWRESKPIVVAGTYFIRSKGLVNPLVSLDDLIPLGNGERVKITIEREGE